MKKACLGALLLLCLLVPVEGRILHYDNRVEVGRQACIIADANVVVVIGPDGYVEPTIIQIENYKIILINITNPGLYMVYLDNKAITIEGWIREIAIRVVRGKSIVSNAKVQIYKEGQLIYTDWTDDSGTVRAKLKSGEYTVVVNDKINQRFSTDADEVVINIATPNILATIPIPVVGAVMTVVVFLSILYITLTKVVG